jgi:hypothetical protein
VTAEVIRASTPTTPVELPTPSAALDEDKDVYRWCVLYEVRLHLPRAPHPAERADRTSAGTHAPSPHTRADAHARSITLFSTAYYSALTLLPMDPPAFTVPLPGRGRQPAVSLTEFPLPDGTWRWASRAWMVDMRADGAVAHDGFEYNACFRARGWSAAAGARGFVRRRRWVRLMMRPAQHPPPADVPAPAPGHDHETEGAAEERVWCGDPAADWARCHAQLRRAGRDGVRLELWATWLGGAPPPARAKQWTEDSRLMPSEALVQTATQAALVPSPEGTRDAIAAVLRDHVRVPTAVSSAALTAPHRARRSCTCSCTRTRARSSSRSSRARAFSPPSRMARSRTWPTSGAIPTRSPERVSFLFFAFSPGLSGFALFTSARRAWCYILSLSLLLTSNSNLLAFFAFLSFPTSCPCTEQISIFYTNGYVSSDRLV